MKIATKLTRNCVFAIEEFEHVCSTMQFCACPAHVPLFWVLHCFYDVLMLDCVLYNTVILEMMQLLSYYCSVRVKAEEIHSAVYFLA